MGHERKLAVYPQQFLLAEEVQDLSSESYMPLIQFNKNKITTQDRHNKELEYR